MSPTVPEFRVVCIEGIPVIIRFKTKKKLFSEILVLCIEGIPVIIRFKTLQVGHPYSIFP